MDGYNPPETRQEGRDIHNEDISHRTQIYSQDYIQIYEIKQALDTHIKMQLINDEITSENFKKLMPLTEIIPTINSMVEDRKANTIIGRRIVKILGVMGAVASILWAAVSIWHSIEKP